MMMPEPSVLDYVRSRLWPRSYARVEIPPASKEAAVSEALEAPKLEAPSNNIENITALGVEAAPVDTASAQSLAAAWPWLAAGGLALALLGQAALGPGPGRSWMPGALLLGAAAVLTVLAVLRSEWSPSPPAAAPISAPFRINLLSLALGLLLSAAAFVFFVGDPPEFNFGNLILLGGGLYLVISALWAPPADWRQRLEGRLRRLRADPRLTFTLDPPAAAALLAIAAVLFFRFYRLGDTPPEMNSDHAEKILDILRVVNGERPIFFPGNGGREALIFYFGAGLHNIFGMELGFMLLKTASTLIGLASLPYIYGLGKQYGGKRLGWLAFTLMGIAYWPNVVARFGLRLPFYMLFTAALMFHLVRALQHGRRGDFVWAGVWLGLSVYGYTPNRLLPLIVLLAAALYLLHHLGDPARRRFGVTGLLVVVVISLVLFIPLLGYILSEPALFLARTLTRVTGVEQPLDASPVMILAGNLGQALAMFSWDAGEIWPISIPHYPALGIAAGALFIIGLAAALARYARCRHWLDLFLPLSIPLLLLPSMLALAFPSENPNLYRAGGAAVPVFVLAAAGLDGIIHVFSAGGRRRIAWGAALALLLVAAVQDYTWVFDTYRAQYRMAAWNASEIGAVARDHAERNGGPDTVWVMGFPHWVDTRLVAINAGYPDRDFELFPEQLETTLGDPRPQLFILNKDDTAAVEILRGLYPMGTLSHYASKTPTKEFQIYYVPPQEVP